MEEASSEQRQQKLAFDVLQGQQEQGQAIVGSARKWRLSAVSIGSCAWQRCDEDLSKSYREIVRWRGAWSGKRMGKSSMIMSEGLEENELGPSGKFMAG